MLGVGGYYPWHICKISLITKAQYPLEFRKKNPMNWSLTRQKFSARWKNSAREKKSLPEKILKFPPEKKRSHPEKKYENVPEKTSNCPRKKIQKWARKNFPTEEKPRKNTKNRFFGHFSFSRVKKSPLLPDSTSSVISPVPLFLTIFLWMLKWKRKCPCSAYISLTSKRIGQSDQYHWSSIVWKWKYCKTHFSKVYLA